MNPLLPSLPDGARAWVYVADAPLSSGQRRTLEQHLSAFLARWTSHGRRVEGAAAVVEDCFLVVGGHIPGGEISGCGIDASVHAVEEAARTAGVGWLPGTSVAFREASGAVRTVTRPEFRALVGSGAVSAATPVFDTAVRTLGELRRGFEMEAGRAWHARVFRIPEAV